MRVFIDIEWYEPPKGHAALTQIAAVRVNECLELIDTFDSLICPDVEVDDFFHIGFNGANKDDYLNAPKSECVLSAFLSWLSENDELYFWHESSAFLLRNYLPGFPNRMRVLQKRIRESLPDGMSAKGDFYDIAKRYRLKRIYPKHCAKNDVIVLLGLIVHIGHPTEELSDDVDSSVTTAKVSRRKKRELGRTASLILGKDINPIDGYRFVYNSKEKLLHRVDCPNLIWEKDCRGFATLQGAAKKYQRGCICCMNLLDEFHKRRKSV